MKTLRNLVCVDGNEDSRGNVSQFSLSYMHKVIYKKKCLIICQFSNRLTCKGIIFTQGFESLIFLTSSPIFQITIFLELQSTFYPIANHHSKIL